MEVSREDLVERFRERSDEELLSHLRSRDLTPLAAEVAASTLNSRGLELPDNVSVESSGEEPDLETTQEVLSTPALQRTRGDDVASSSALSWSSAPVNPIAPARNRLPGRIFMLAVGALLTYWLWTALIH